jgi:hypothetical protein
VRPSIKNLGCEPATPRLWTSTIIGDVTAVGDRFEEAHDGHH